MSGVEWLGAVAVAGVGLCGLIIGASRLGSSREKDASATLRDVLAQEHLDILGRPIGEAKPKEALPPLQFAARQPPPDDIDELFTAAFTYLDRHGNRTHRVVTVCISDDEYFAGYCHLRSDYRTFAWEHVVGDVSLSSGEVLAAEDLRVQFA
ncbi:hypothetical protein LQF05_15055 [Stutzerimonas stutzeri]|uniref:hypothetical protein n=1 Tax=Stutzerimonas stutzeri TaxID=316 RepID=UPI0022DE03DB|nr:hypothetical protein [Stutzerimonas stutzeri]WBL59230.1 hypothetical protein LQF05_15055 [Stutzerimonas stutzeri]